MIRFLKIDNEDFAYYLKNSDFIMCKRNFYSSYSEFYVLLDDNDYDWDKSYKWILVAACIITNPEPNKLFIKLFEVSPTYARRGLGTQLFNCIKDWNHDRFYTCTYELESLDDESTGFWKSLGFKEFVNEDGEELMRKVTA